MDEGSKQVVLIGAFAGIGVAIYFLLQKFSSDTKPGEAGGVHKLIGDVLVGELPKDTSTPLELQPPTQPGVNPDVPVIDDYYGPPVLGRMVSPHLGERVERQAYRESYPLTFELQNMTGKPHSGFIDFVVKENALIGGGTVSTQKGPELLKPYERKRFTMQVATETVFTIANADCVIKFQGLPVIFTSYVIA